MRSIKTSELREHLANPTLARWIYNGFDTSVTLEVWEKTQHLLTGPALRTYIISSALRGPALAMMRRGVQIDEGVRAKLSYEVSQKIDRLVAHFRFLVTSVFGPDHADFNPRSRNQLITLFHTWMNVPPFMKFDRKAGVSKIKMNEEALRKIVNYKFASPFARIILSLREHDGWREVLSSGVSPDGRLRCSYNTVGTQFGRWSSNKNVFGGGTNLQNVTEDMRQMFIPSDGHIFVNVDLEQSDSRCVAYLSGDENYIAACESSDLHTYCCRLLWPQRPWTGDPKRDRALADERFFRHFSFRDMSKRGGHATNFYAVPGTISKALQIQKSFAEDFQRIYYKRFPKIRDWQHETIRDLQSNLFLTTPLGRVHTFFDRPRDPETHRKAISFKPQSLTGEILNIGLYRIWNRFDPREIKVLLQIHDAVLFEVPISTKLDLLIPQILSTMLLPVPVTDISGKTRLMKIPLEASVGFNWGKAKPKNPNGLTKWSPGYVERRKPESQKFNPLAQIIC